VAITEDFPPKIFTHNPFLNKTEIFSGTTGKFREIFKDKLRDLNGYEYELFIRYQLGRIIYKNGKLTGTTAFFLDILLEKQNARSKVKHYGDDSSINFKPSKFMEQFEANDFDLMLSSQISRTSNNSEPICSYHPLDYCVVVPKIYTRKSFDYFFVSDFTPQMGAMTLGAIFLGSSIWSFIYYKKLSRSPNSAGHFLFAIFGSFVGQGVRFTKLCLLQNYLVQLFVFGMFFFSNLYTSLLISIQFDDRTTLKINSFADIKKHNFPVHLLEQEYKILNESNYDPDFMKVLIPMEIAYEGREAIENRKGILASCINLKTALEGPLRFVKDLYFILDDKINLGFEYFYYNRLNPYRLKFEYYKNLVFEAGLEHYYHLTEEPAKPKPLESKQEEFVTRFEDLYFVLMAFLVGNLIAFLVFIVEIVWFRLSKIREERRFKNKFQYLP
jgi:hypothetical protein